MASSWTKRHSHENPERARRERARYNQWKKHWLGSNRKWKEVPTKFGDSWNPRLNCWNNEIYRGERDRNSGELTELGKEIEARKNAISWVEDQIKTSQNCPVSGSGKASCPDGIEILLVAHGAEPCPVCGKAGITGVSVSTTHGSFFHCQDCIPTPKIHTTNPQLLR